MTQKLTRTLLLSTTPSQKHLMMCHLRLLSRSLFTPNSHQRRLSTIHTRIVVNTHHLARQPRCPQRHFNPHRPTFRPHTIASPSNGLLAGKNAIITGSSRGIGAAIAERFAQEGARCILVGRDEGRLASVKERLWKVEGKEHVVKIGDVGYGEFWRGLRGEVRFSCF